MSNNLILNSKNLVPSTNNNTFQYNFIKGNFAIPPDSYMGVSQITLPYSWYNVSSVYGNNTFQYIIPTQTSTFTGNTAGSSTTLTVSVLTGYIAVGAMITGTGIPAGTYVVSQSSGTTGSTGNYVLSVAVNLTAIACTTLQTITTVVLADGFYTISDIQDALWASLRAGGYFYYTTQSTVFSGQTSNTYPTYLYPIQLKVNPNKYTNQFIFVPFQVSSINTQTQFGSSVVYNNASTTGFPANVSSAQIVITGTVTSTSTLFGNLVGFLSGTYPSTNAGYAPPQTVYNANPVAINGNTLTAINPPFPPLGSIVNGIIVRCSLAVNDVGMPTDVLDTFAIPSTSFGSNIIYMPVANNYTKIKAGKYSSFTISFADQNGNPLYMNDPNLIIGLSLKLGTA